jgi:cobaltochelatase CobN
MARNLVLRSDGKLVNVVPKRGQLFICATGCCCGHTDRNYAPVFKDLYHNEWGQRKLRNKVHLNNAGCLGPCPLANVVLLLFDGRPVWFHSVNTEGHVVAIFDYIDAMLAANSFLPPPALLSELTFNGFAWNGENSGDAHPARYTPPALPKAEPELVRTPGILFLSHSDTDFLTLSQVTGQAGLPSDFPSVCAANPAHYRDAAETDAFLDEVLPVAEIVIVRLLGGRASWKYGIEKLTRWARENERWLICLPGTYDLDPELMALSTVGVPLAHEVAAYLQLGGVRNYEHALRFLSDHLLTTGLGYEPPLESPDFGIYVPTPTRSKAVRLKNARSTSTADRPTIGLLFYRAHYLAGNTDFVDAIIEECATQELNILPVYAKSLKELAAGNNNRGGNLPAALTLFLDEQGRSKVDVIISTLSLAIGSVNPDGPTQSGWSVQALANFDVPILQAITAGGSRVQWEGSMRGLSPLDTAMNVALPEFDGRIISVPISFKENPTNSSSKEAHINAPVVKYVPDAERIKRMVGQAKRLALLRHKTNANKRIAFVLTNSPSKAARIGNAVGLDAPASLLYVLQAMQEVGYKVQDLPPTGDELIHNLIERCSYDVEVLSEQQLASAAARVPNETYTNWFGDLPARNREQMTARWGAPPGEAYVHDNNLALAGLEYGNVFVALQPPRGYGMNPDAIYHVPDLAPTHNYYALYRWLAEPVERGGWGADAIVHMGKHGTLEWLPGKGVGVSETCYPDQFLGDLPLVYPFILNDPGEGTQAKRRGHAVIIDHLTPPMMQAETYGALAELAQLVNEYYQVEQLDPSKLPLLQAQIWELMQRTRLDTDLNLQEKSDSSSLALSDAMSIVQNQSGHGHTHEWDAALTEDGLPVTLVEMGGKDFAHLVENIDGYLCELAGAQIRDGLHILGQLAGGEQLNGLLFNLTRLPNLNIPSLRAGVAAVWGLDLAALLDKPGAKLKTGFDVSALAEFARGKLFASNADLIEVIDALCHRLLSELAAQNFAADAIEPLIERELGFAPGAKAKDDVRQTLTFVCRQLMPALCQTGAEITNLLHALDGGYVPAGPSGAPTRGMAHVLPTGRNFYAVDPRTLPSMVAWQVGEQLAKQLLERHLAEEGRYPESVGLSIWGTSAMRTHGDDLAEVFALLGVRPVWQKENRRLVGVEVVPLNELGRPRIDVISRISGFFRDAFPYLISLLDEAYRKVAELDEPLDQNFVRKHYLQDKTQLAEQGVPESEAQRQALYRVFGSKPGSYGAGILPLIDERNWQDVSDLAEAYINWGGYAYTAAEYGSEAHSAYRQVLSGVEIAVKNQDNREHDIFDSDDYLQYHGGMIAAIRALSGKAPKRYFGDNSDPARVKVRDLKEETLRVFRSRVVNPKWLESIQRHGYKGGLELAATVDYLFGYDATSEVLEDWMYEQLANTYLLDDQIRQFLERSNPWALKDMSGRLIEAAKRKMWETPSEQILNALYALYQDAEDNLELGVKS